MFRCFLAGGEQRRRLLSVETSLNTLVGFRKLLQGIISIVINKMYLLPRY